jgi:hypothetical protein
MTVKKTGQSEKRDRYLVKKTCKFKGQENLSLKFMNS